MRLVTPEDFPPSWRAGEAAVRSRDSGYYSTRFMLRLDKVTSRKLAMLTQTFDRSAAEVISQLIAQATPEDFPSSWQIIPHARRTRAVQPDDDGLAGRTPPSKVVDEAHAVGMGYAVFWYRRS